MRQGDVPPTHTHTRAMTHNLSYMWKHPAKVSIGGREEGRERSSQTTPLIWPLHFPASSDGGGDLPLVL